MDNSLFDLTGRTILIVDDNAANLGVVADYLESAFHIFTAMDGADAMETAAKLMPNLILLDVMMPGMDGFEVCQHLKANPLTHDIPVIFMTALASTGDKVKGFEVGAVDYVTKPINQEELLARIRTHLIIQDQQAQLRAMNAVLVKHAAQLELSSRVAQQVASILDLDVLLTETVNRVQQQFDYYCVGVWLLDAARDNLVLRAFAGQDQARQFDAGFTIAVVAKPSVIAHACRTQAPYLANDVQHDPYYFFWESLPETRAELILPLGYGQLNQNEYKYWGVLDIQDTQINAFTSEDVTVLHMLANQVAVAIRNAQLYAEVSRLTRTEQEA